MTIEVYRKHLWLGDTRNQKIETKFFAVKGKVRQIETVQRVLKNVCNKKNVWDNTSNS